eukprot:2561812-Ditylum_brightwellii.AAC.1
MLPRRIRLAIRFVLQIPERPQNRHRLVPIRTHPLQHLDRRARPGRYRTIEAVLNAVVQSARVEVLPGLEQQRVLSGVIARVRRPRSSQVPPRSKQIRANVAQVPARDQHGVAK